ncbi:hypothetical protein LV475_00910 [Guyparkeria hydrothermalis]|uniref:hypothetical protein n=1 Tax=Guyparkeria TaxID=2035712 RepID=UPI0010AB9363|nr:MULTISPECIES: hypothetical protein [Guyparkeria]MCL7750170.1 hypothetical protein [Guyparkeria hydrothermalis]TKA88652.1 hypothetical protein FAZ79_09300 [Guyparkeria sp. SB14A]
MKIGAMRPALPITVAYLLLASLWIWVTQWLLGRLGGAHWEISTAGLVFGEIFVLVTGAMLYVLVDRLTAARQGVVDFGHERARPRQGWLTAMLVALVLIAVMQIFIAAVAARQYAPLLLDKAQREVANLAAIRAIELENWVEERDQQVDALAQRSEWLQAWVTRLDEGEVDGFPDDLRRGSLLSRFRSITLLDPDRNPQLQTGATNVVPPDMLQFDQAAVTGDVHTVTRFTRGRGGVDLFWILPIYDERTAVSRGPWYLLLWTRLNTESLLADAESDGRRVRAAEGLRTLLINAPADPGSGSSFWPMLVLDPRQESSTVAETPSGIVDRIRVGLSEIEGDPDAEEGVTRIEGADRVYATVELPRLSARLLVLQDRRDVLAPVDQLEKWLSLTALLSTLGLFAALLFLWRFLRGRYRARSADILREREFWHHAWLEMPSLGLIEIDPRRLQVIVANRQAAEWFGRAREDLVGSALFDLFEPTDPASPLAGDPETALPAYFARGAVDRLALEGRLPGAEAVGPMWLELRVLRDGEGRPERMIGMLRPARATDDIALRAQIDHLTSRCASVSPAERQSLGATLAEQPASPFFDVRTISLAAAEIHDRAALIAYLEAHLPESLRHHQALLRPLADELGRVLVSGEGRWVHSDAAEPAEAGDGHPAVINAVGHSVVMLPEPIGEPGIVAVRLYISQDRWEMTPGLLEAIERLHRVCCTVD